MNRVKKVVIGIVIFIVSVMPISAKCDVRTIQWERGNTYVPSNNLYGIILGNGILIAFGGDGILYTSIDGETWVKRVTNTCEVLTDGVWNGKQFLVVGNNNRGSNTVLISKDGSKWANYDTKIGYDLKRVIWDGHQYIAVGSCGTVLSSKDGIKWVKHETGIGEEIYGIAYNGKQYVMITQSNYKGVYVSTDLIRWNSIELEGNNWIYGITYAKGLFVLLSYNNEDGTDQMEIRTSKDGNKWRCTYKYKTLTQYNDILWDGKKFVVLGGDDGSFTYSYDGSTWVEPYRILQDYKKYNSFIYYKGRYWIVGNSLSLSSITSGIDDVNQISNKFCNFKEYSLEKQLNDDGYRVLENYVPKVFYCNNSFVTTSNLVSTDGAIWCDQPFYCTNSKVFGNRTMKYNNLIQFKNKYFCTSYQFILSSDNFSHWDVSYKVGTISTQLFSSMATNGKVLLGCTYDGIVCYTYDGVKWNNLSLKVLLGINDVSWDGKEFIISCYDQNIFYVSSDGVHWSRNQVKTSDSSIRINKIIYDGKKYLLVGEFNNYKKHTDNPGLLWSTDMHKWNIIEFKFNGFSFFDILFNKKNNECIMVGGTGNKGSLSNVKYNYSGGILCFSNDGLKWSEKYITSNTLTSISTDGTIYVIYGDKGTIIRGIQMQNKAFVKGS